MQVSTPLAPLAPDQPVGGSPSDLLKGFPHSVFGVLSQNGAFWICWLILSYLSSVM